MPVGVSEKGEEPFLFLSDDGRVVDSERQRRKQGDGEGLRSAGYAYAANEAEEIERVAAHGVWPVSNQDVVFITCNVEGAPDAPEGAYAGHEAGQEHEAFFNERRRFPAGFPEEQGTADSQTENQGDEGAETFVE